MAQREPGLPEQISERIIQLILDENLKQGDRLPKEAVLVERLGAGRSTVREAMKLLQSRNIVRIKQGSGTYVASNPGVADDPLGFTFIEDKQQVARIKELCDDYSAADTAFHNAIAESCGNLVVPRLMGVLKASVPLFIDVTGRKLVAETIRTHRGVADAIAAHDASAAYDAMYLHLVYNRNIIAQEAMEG